MTYSDLLHKVSFDEIAPYIEKYRSNKDIALFKSHYDMLQQIEPKKKQNSKNEIVISIWPEGNTKDNQSHYLRATSILGKNWEEDLAKELVFKLGVRQIWGDIAACCLSASSIYGFTPEMLEEDKKDKRIKAKDPFEEFRYKAGLILKKIEGFGGRFPLVSEVMELPAFVREVNFLVNIEMSYYQGLTKWKHCEVPGKNIIEKWIIDGRYSLRMWNIGRFVCDAFSSGQVENSYSPEELFALFLVNNYDVYRYLSFADNMEDRGKWLWELVTKYNAFFHSIYSNVVLCIGMSHEHPATDSDIHYFNEIMSWLRDMSKNINIKWDVNYDDSLGKQLRLSAIFYE